jgi:glucose/arabinose dehydrogenase
MGRAFLRLLLFAAALASAVAPAHAQADPSSIRLPPGFTIEVYAQAPGARTLAVDPRSGAVFVGTRQDHIYRIAPGAAPDIIKQDFHDPNGVCFAPDGTLYVAERNRIRAFPGANVSAPGIDIVAQGALIPPEEAHASNHAARVCRVGPDGALYVTVGEPYNVPPKDKQALYARVGMGAILRFERHGEGYTRSIYAAGIRNSVGLDFNPRDRTLWFTDNQVDMMGDDIPPGELNRATRPGQTFGFPWFGGGHVRTAEYADQTPPEDAVFPQVEMVAHAADLGMTFYRGSQFPAGWRGAIFSAQHGSWNRTVPVGARVMVTLLKPDGTADHTQVFADGWLDPVAHRYTGRPVDVAELPDGSLLVSDDYAGVVWRISYQPHANAAPYYRSRHAMRAVS